MGQGKQPGMFIFRDFAVYSLLALLLGFAQNLDSDFIKNFLKFFFCKIGHILLD